MSPKKVLITAAALVLIAVLPASYLTIIARAQVQAPLAAARPNGECVKYASNSTIEMCLHKFADGTRCVAAGGGGYASAGAGVALQCDFN